VDPDPAVQAVLFQEVPYIQLGQLLAYTMNATIAPKNVLFIDPNEYLKNRLITFGNFVRNI
ncbi:MAG: hypothetical protein ABEI86_00950, partial [Halobacteriaceae archaeon]